MRLWIGASSAGALLLLALLGVVKAAPSALVTWPGYVDQGQTGFVIRRTMGGGPVHDIARVEATARSYTDTEVVIGQRYCWHVIAYNAMGTSLGHADQAQAEACATVPGIGVPPLPLPLPLPLPVPVQCTGTLHPTTHTILLTCTTGTAPSAPQEKK